MRHGSTRESTADIVVIGSLVMDRKFFPAGTFALGSAAGTLHGVERHHGGVGRNVAVNLARLGARSTFVGLSGFGADAAELEDVLAATGVEVRVRRTTDGVGRFDVLLDGRGNQVCARPVLPDPAQGKPLCTPDLAARVERADAVVVEGGLDEGLLEWTARQARGRAVPVCGMPTRQGDLGPRPRLLPLYDILILNTAEARAVLDGTVPAGAESARRACPAAAVLAACLHRLGPRVVVVTGGPDGAAVAWPRCPDAVHLPTEPVPCADDTGAGDALASAFLFGLTSGEGPRAALARGLSAAALTVGCRRTTCRALGRFPRDPPGRLTD
ncbi:hypothetical protein CUT44_11955 [Streptomyces carminius]|uniref:Carbohydrate kinase PfkB domain-containing protein n=1 Tax=Streptomyces carminius TaxID=2665496 RepID=A0A2M8LZL6_9ACTN|nr:carbohydrate kinase family protein [Streptomyces carminius]PJE97396.1 hypothetical protein CUT44_11955 [Streptomyces carminius]